ncbi:oligosaccharide flippase family protein [Flavobacterium sp. 245]|uniref:oligosaccharide flippase family protein n=1 Tax=Flavobacterium sp. 245 TaxID=2512115 RepID=UPI00105EA5E8|nr:oligosaccharide flippase family protein [Flavobacterium sp. 245]TDP00910.1 O-antigen/teichoic acid export membrane protein [Flavobacterium sp. 245]
MNSQQSSYRNIMKATSIFGGVQIFTILISILRSKFIALFIGSAGIGIVGLLTSTIGVVGSITNFGLGTSAVRDVSAANAAEDKTRISIIITALKHWVWVTGILGMIVVIVMSPFLSKVTFGSNSYIYPFILVSVTLLFNQLSTGQLAILQGTQKLQYLAKASLSGNFLGLIITLPLYYFFGASGIVPAMIIASIISFCISWYFANKSKIISVTLTRKQVYSEGKHMLKMGFMISLNGLLVSATAYLIQIFINSRGGVEQVGLFTAGFSIINVYVGLIFTAMATDYFPRLSSVSHSNELCKNVINQQAEISILILGPIIMVFLVFIKLVIIILYSHKFLPIEEMVLWLALAVFFKAAAWSVGFILLAKGASKIFFWNDLTGSLYMLLLDVLGYYLWGLTGLGISFFMGYILYFVQILILSNVKYSFSFNSSFIKIFAIQFILAVGCFIVVKLIEKPYSYVVGIIFIIISCYYSYIELDRRIGIKNTIDNFFQNRLKR